MPTNRKRLPHLYDPEVHSLTVMSSGFLGPGNGCSTRLREGVDYTIDGDFVTLLRRGLNRDSITFGWGASAAPASPPVADFSADITSGDEPLEVTFTDTSSNSPTSWAWDFGDGDTSTLQNPTHTYADAGTYTVELVATNASGSDTETKTDYVTVDEPGAPQPDAWDPATMLGADGLHPNDTGMTYLADAYEWALADAGKTPASGSLITAYGDSWTANDIHNTAGQRAIQQLCDRLDLTLTNQAVGGYKAGDCAARAIGTTGTYAPDSADIVLVQAGINDLGQTDSAQQRAAITHYLRALFAVLSAVERIEETAFSYSGTWGTNTGVQGASGGGQNKGTSTDGVSASYTITTPGTYYLLSHGTESFTGGQMTVSQAGTPLATLDLNNQSKNTGNLLTIGYGPAAVRIPDVAAGVLTVTFNTLGRPSAQGFLDALVRISSTPQTILAVKPVESLYAPFDKPALLDYIRDQYDVLAAEFGSHVVVCDPDPSWTP